MESLIMLVLLAAVCGQSALVLILGREVLGRNHSRLPDAVPAELPEEQEARRLAAEAQRRYEQGFVNLMRYDGSPGRKEGDL